MLKMPITHEIEELERSLDRVRAEHRTALQEFELLDAEMNRLSNRLEEAEAWKNDLLSQMYRIEDKLAVKRNQLLKNERISA